MQAHTSVQMEELIHGQGFRKTYCPHIIRSHLTHTNAALGRRSLVTKHNIGQVPDRSPHSDLFLVVRLRLMAYATVYPGLVAFFNYLVRTDPLQADEVRHRCLLSPDSCLLYVPSADAGSLYPHHVDSAPSPPAPLPPSCLQAVAGTRWFSDVKRGAQHRLVRCRIEVPEGCPLRDKTFAEAARYLYRNHHVVLLGLEIHGRPPET